MRLMGGIGRVTGGIIGIAADRGALAARRVRGEYEETHPLAFTAPCSRCGREAPYRPSEGYPATCLCGEEWRPS